ncbi:MAG: hypothetical protein SV186_00775 [Candidatus Nanohaloarchaea archaeon]|nr:hypothetical protein [Candidatus Nanohaloarchaea archaeon]
MRRYILSLVNTIQNWASASRVEREHVRRSFWISLSLLLIPLGSTAALFAAFHGESWVIYIGFVLFFSGYRLAQYGIYERKTGQWLPKQPVRLITDIDILSKETAMILGGGAAISYGFKALTQSLTASRPAVAIGAAMLILAGYMVAHLATNNTLI